MLVEAVLRLHPQRRTVFAGPVIFKGDVFEEFMAVTKKWWESGVSDKEAIHEVFTVAPDGSGVCSSNKSPIVAANHAVILAH